MNNYAKFKEIYGEERKAAIRAELSAAPHSINFNADVFTISHSQRSVLSDIAKAVGYRKSSASFHTLGGAFFCYLAKGATAQDAAKRTPGKRWNNHNITKG